HAGRRRLAPRADGHPGPADALSGSMRRALAFLCRAASRPPALFLSSSKAASQCGFFSSRRCGANLFHPTIN
ncbi:MAG: hypothetical protein WBG17_03165, partial [Burkholderiaceae bacterium]